MDKPIANLIKEGQIYKITIETEEILKIRIDF